ncbi:MAG: hypothetical protein IH886_00715 [Nitrospinae bacterium]|nr:hypothetical protein [Nitrospinota bacterium]
METDFTLLSRKPTWFWEDLEGLLFSHALKNTQRNFLQDTKFHKLEKTQYDFGGWIFSAMDSGELEAIRWGRDPIKGTPGVEIKRGIICSWLFENDVLGWLKERGVEVCKDAIQIIKDEAKKAADEPAPVVKTEPTQPEPELEPILPAVPDGSGAGAKPKQDWDNVTSAGLEAWEESKRKATLGEIYNDPNVQKALSAGQTVTQKYTETKIRKRQKEVENREAEAQKVNQSKGRKLKVTKR